MKNKNDYQNEVNPAFSTAFETLYMLAEAGNAEAMTYIKKTGISSEAKKAIKGLAPEAILCKEARYFTVSKLLTESGYKSMLDIGCGCTPRAIMCRDKGIDYVGVDLPVTVDKMLEASEKLFGATPHPIYVSGDATNPESVIKAADFMDGELFISSEGLLTYLTESELLQMFDAVKAVLKKHGGAWYTSDMEFDAELLLGTAEEEQNGEDNSDAYFKSIKFNTLEEKLEFFRGHGFNVKQIPFFTDGTSLKAMKRFNSKRAEELTAVLKSFSLWEITLEGKALNEPVTVKATPDLAFEYINSDDNLTVNASGRIDSLSSPELLETIEKNYEKTQFKTLTVNAENVEYISSAGLRILLIMVKRLGVGNVIVKNAPDAVVKIFETVGFTDIIKID